MSINSWSGKKKLVSVKGQGTSGHMVCGLIILYVSKGGLFLRQILAKKAGNK